MPKSAVAFSPPARYKPTGEILKGGQGDVHICNDGSLERAVAIKVFHDVSDVTALMKEIEGRAKISSKHVAELYECLYVGSTPLALVIEYVPGESLVDVSTHPADLAGKILLLYQIACGIADIHAAGVIHRDIKPANMKVDGAGILKIFDLGISNLDASAASTVGGAGTYIYRAPEIYNVPTVVTPAADVYAIGVIAWYLFTQKFPSALAEIPPQSSGKALPSLQSVVPELAPAMRVLDQTLHVNPHDRPAAATVRDLLGRYITHDRRRGVFAHHTGVYELVKMGNSTRIDIKPYGTLRVAYTDGRFVVREVTGSVFVNNAPAVVDEELPDSCVLTFGPPEAGWRRVFVPFDVSQPGIVL